MKHHIDKSISLFVVFIILAIISMVAIDSSITGDFLRPIEQCSEGSYRCDNNMLQFCEDSYWVNKEACAFGCRNNACLVLEEKCTEDSFRCHGQNVQVCNNGRWQHFRECWNNCAAGICVN